MPETTTHPLAEARKQQGYTQHGLAAKSGVSRSLIAMIEMGLRPGRSARGRLSRALNLSQRELFG